MKALIYVLLSILLFLFISSCTTLEVAQPETEVPQTEEPEQPGEETAPPEEPAEKSYARFEQINITRGEHKDKIVITWEKDETVTETVILRSLKKEDAFTEIARTSGSVYEDTEIEPGMKIYYRTVHLSGTSTDTSAETQTEQQNSDEENTASDTSENFEIDDTQNGIAAQYPDVITPESEDTENGNYGYAAAVKPTPKSLNKLMNSYTKGKTPPTSDIEKKYQKMHLDYLREKYEHPVKLNMILTVTRPYITSGKLEVHNGFTHYNHVRELRTVYIFNKDRTAVYIFNNNVTSGNLKRDDMRSLFERLIRNSVGFCGYAGEKEVTDDKGHKRIIPAYDVVALAAQYWPEYRNWREATYLIVTSNKRLRREIQKAQSN